MKILFVLGFPNPFPGAAWTRIGFLAEKWSKQGFDVDILGTFTPKTFNQRGTKLFCGKTRIFNIIPNVFFNNAPIGFIFNSQIAFLLSSFFLIVKRPKVAIVSVPTGDVGIGALMACKILGIKYVIDYRDEWEDYLISLMSNECGKIFYRVAKRIAGWLYTKCKLFVTVTSNFKVV